MSENNPFENINIKINEQKENEPQPTDAYRIEKINSWLQKRLNYKIGSIDFKSEIRKLEIKLSKTNQSITVTEYQIGKQENQFNSVTEELTSTTDTFKQIANSCKIEWFRNDWIAYKPQNLIQEIKYWLN